MSYSERKKMETFFAAIDLADPNMDRNEDNPITDEEVEQSVPWANQALVMQIVHFINTRPSDPFANL